MLQHELAARVAGAGRRRCVILVVVNAAAAERRLLSGGLCCPECGGVVLPHGFARARPVRGFTETTELRPRRARCPSCAKTHVILPGQVVPRRRDDASVIGRALLRAATGHSGSEIASELGRARTTVRNWLRRFSDNADALQVAATRELLTYDARADPMRLAWLVRPVARAVEALGSAAAAVVRLFGPLPPGTSPWGVASVVVGGHLLTPGFSP